MGRPSAARLRAAGFFGGYAAPVGLSSYLLDITLAALADQRLRATPEQLCDALDASTALHPVYRRLLHMMLAELRIIDEQTYERIFPGTD